VPGAGLAANSAVCYCLGITSVDPAEHQLLFDRFISEERTSRPTSTSISSTSGARR
jgi:error-prone DNA polymerase